MWRMDYKSAIDAAAWNIEQGLINKLGQLPTSRFTSSSNLLLSMNSPPNNNLERHLGQDLRGVATETAKDWTYEAEHKESTAYRIETDQSQ